MKKISLFFLVASFLARVGLAQPDLPRPLLNPTFSDIVNKLFPNEANPPVLEIRDSPHFSTYMGTFNAANESITTIGYIDWPNSSSGTIDKGLVLSTGPIRNTDVSGDILDYLNKSDIYKTAKANSTNFQGIIPTNGSAGWGFVLNLILNKGVLPSGSAPTSIGDVSFVNFIINNEGALDKNIFFNFRIFFDSDVAFASTADQHRILVSKIYGSDISHSHETQIINAYSSAPGGQVESIRPARVCDQMLLNNNSLIDRTIVGSCNQVPGHNEDLGSLDLGYNRSSGVFTQKVKLSAGSKYLVSIGVADGNSFRGNSAMLVNCSFTDQNYTRNISIGDNVCGMLKLEGIQVVSNTDQSIQATPVLTYKGIPIDITTNTFGGEPLPFILNYDWTNDCNLDSRVLYHQPVYCKNYTGRPAKECSISLKVSASGINTDVQQTSCSETYSAMVRLPNPAPNMGCCEYRFSPRRGKSYVLSAWVKQGDQMTGNGSLSQPTTYQGPVVRLEYEGMPSESIEMRPEGPIINGWQRVIKVFNVPIAAKKMTVVFKNSFTQTSDPDAFFDDLRISPVSSQMTTSVYQNASGRMAAQLDNNNYATFFEYDEEGNFIRTKRETTKGIITINEKRTNKSNE